MRRSVACVRGFTLLEMIGVLSVLAILAALIVPVLIRRMDSAAAQREKSELAAIAASLKNTILRSKTVPDESTWVSAVSSDLALPPQSISTTPRGQARVFLISTNGWLGQVSLPFRQTTNGTVQVNGARLMIVSSLGKPLTGILASGRPPSATFSDIWDTPQGTRPASLSAWTGNPEDLQIQRLNLDPLFHRLILVNGAAGAVGGFSIDQNGPLPVPRSPTNWNRFYLEGTVAGFHDTNGVLLARELIKRDISFVFEYDTWRSEIMDGVHDISEDDFAKLVDLFLVADTRPRAKADQYEAVLLMYDYMYNYTCWANDPEICFNCYGGSPGDTAQDAIMKAAFNALDKVADRLLKK